MEEGEKDGFSPIFVSSLDMMRHFIRRKEKEWIPFNAHKENFHILGKQMGREQGRGVCGVCKRGGKRKILKERRNKGKKRNMKLGNY